MVTAIMNRLRIQPVRMIWQSPGFIGSGGVSVAFLILVVTVVLYAGMDNESYHLFLGMGYFTGGICWCAATRLSTSTLVTDYAIFRNTHEEKCVLGWSQIVDFFVQERKGKTYYIFLYVDDEGRHARFEVPVPVARKDLFGSMVTRFVEERPLSAPERAYG